MKDNLRFTHQLPGNKKSLKVALIGLTVTLILCIIGIVVSRIFWDEYTYTAYSLRANTNVVSGWPAKLSSWSWWLGGATILVMPMIYFMQDLRNPSIGLMTEGLFINQQLMRNTTIKFENIKQVEKKDDSYMIHIIDPKPVVKQAFFIFKPFVKSNLQSGMIDISSMYTKGNIEEFMNALKEHLKPE